MEEFKTVVAHTLSSHLDLDLDMTLSRRLGDLDPTLPSRDQDPTLSIEVL